MKFREFLCEGGQAIKGSSRITQEEVALILPEVLKKIREALKLPSSKVKLIGSAGKKLDPKDTSGDLDIAVECSEDSVKGSLKSLAGENSSREMNGIGVFSFGQTVGDKIVQVDLMPVNNIKFAEWSFQANSADIALGLKGAHRNELFFAVAKFMPQEVLEEDAEREPIKVKRFFYDLRKGLMQGIKSREGKKKLSKNFATTEKKVLTDDPKKITEMMFGEGVTPAQVSTFNGTLDIIRAKDFQYHDKVRQILDLAKTGIEKKGLKVPSQL
jgi:hypothetical protein